MLTQSLRGCSGHYGMRAYAHETHINAGAGSLPRYNLGAQPHQALQASSPLSRISIDSGNAETQCSTGHQRIPHCYSS